MSPSRLAVPRAGALAGALAFLLLALVQRWTAWHADQLWSLDAPWLGLVRDPLLGAVAGALVASVADALRAVLAPDLDRRCLALASAALLPAAGRALASAALRGRQGLPGGRLAALALTAAACVVAVAWLARWLDRRQQRRPDPTRDPVLGRDGVGTDAVLERERSWPALPAALLVGGLALVGVQLVHLIWLADKHAADLRGLLGLPALALLVGGGLVGLLAAVGTLRGGATRPAAWVALVLATAYAQRLAPPAATHRSPGQWPTAPPRSAGLLAPDGVHPERPLNVLVVVLDTLRRDAVSAYGHVSGTTPHLDGLAARGLRFDDALANGCWTVPSHASLFTGLEVSRHGAGHLQERLRAEPAGRDGPRHRTLAELLGGAGWDTAAFVANMHVSASHGYDRGFDRFEEVWRAGQGDHDVLAPALKAWLGWGAFDKGGQLLSRGAADWIGARADAPRPWFLFVNLLDAHAPYTPPAPYDRRFLAADEPSPAAAELLARPLAHTHRAGVDPAVADELWRAYLGGVAYTDALLGRLLEALERSGQAEHTLVLVTSDHGEHFGGRGLLGHGQDLSRELLAIPLVLAGPGLPQGAVDATPVSLVDVLPSLLSACGVAIPEGVARGTARPALLPGAPGRSPDRPRLVEKLPLFVEHPDAFRERVAPVTPGGGELAWAVARQGLVVGDRQLERAAAPAAERLLTGPADGAWSGPRDALWALRDDRAQADALERRLEALLAELTPAVRDTRVPGRDEAARDQLRALGYVGDSEPIGPDAERDGDSRR